MITEVYRFVVTNGHPGIMCLICDRISYNPNDIEYIYCGNCRKFLYEVPKDFVRENDQPVLGAFRNVR